MIFLIGIIFQIVLFSPKKENWLVFTCTGTAWMAIIVRKLKNRSNSTLSQTPQPIIYSPLRKFGKRSKKLKSIVKANVKVACSSPILLGFLYLGVMSLL